jgi:hypothetical protein
MQKKTNMADFSCLPVNSSLGCLAKSLGALKPVPWEKVKVISKILHFLYKLRKSNLKFTNCANIIKRLLKLSFININNIYTITYIL